jgi:Tfp pilus assembly protein PilX
MVSGKVFMWNVSEPIADLLFNISSATLIVGGLLVFVGTIGSITMSAAKEYFTNERIAANEAATERAKADAEIAREGAIAAHAKALEAELALEKYKAPRTLSPSQIENLISKMKEFVG